MVRTDSHRIPRVPCYSGNPYSCFKFQIRGCHPLWPFFPKDSSIIRNLTPGSYNPTKINPDGLGCSHFARHYFGNRFRFLLLCLLRCFSSAGSLHIPIYSKYDNQPLRWLGSPIRKSPDQSVCAAPRSLSQLVTSFIA